MDKKVEKETLEAIDRLIKNSKEILPENQQEDNKNIEIENLKHELKTLNNKIEFIDANLKTNYITIIFGLLFYILSNKFELDKITGIDNNLSLIIFLVLISLFFYKENMIMSKLLLKKIIFK